jgi:hypothetical protein
MVSASNRNAIPAAQRVQEAMIAAPYAAFLPLPAVYLAGRINGLLAATLPRASYLAEGGRGSNGPFFGTFLTIRFGRVPRSE